jgi:enamine deaminase RidA (YjgF/YER057c/UK114 family)
MRKLISSQSPLEPRIGFSRAVRVGRIVAVTGTAPIAEDGSVACPGDVYGQTRRCLEIIAKAVADAGLSLDTVVRTRIMLTDRQPLSQRPARKDNALELRELLGCFCRIIRHPTRAAQWRRRSRVEAHW